MNYFLTAVALFSLSALAGDKCDEIEQVNWQDISYGGVKAKELAVYDSVTIISFEKIADDFVVAKLRNKQWTKEIPGAAPFDSFIAAGPSNSLAFIDSDYTVHLKWNDDW